MEYLDMNVFAGHLISFFNGIDIDQPYTMASFHLEVFSPKDLEISLAVIRRNGFTQAGKRKRDTNRIN